MVVLALSRVIMMAIWFKQEYDDDNVDDDVDDGDDGDEEEDEAEANHDDDGSMAYIDQCFAGVSMTVQSLVKAFRSWVSAAAVNFGPESRA